MLEMESSWIVPDTFRAVQTRHKSKVSTTQVVQGTKIPEHSTTEKEQTPDWEGWTKLTTCSKSVLRKKQEEDPAIKLVLESKKRGESPDYSVIVMSSPACRHYFHF